VFTARSGQNEILSRDASELAGTKPDASGDQPKGVREPSSTLTWHDQREHRSIRECHGVDGAAVEQVRALPERHTDWDSSLPVQHSDASSAEDLVQ